MSRSLRIFLAQLRGKGEQIVCETVSLLIDSSNKAVGCIKAGMEIACVMCNSDGRGYCPAGDYSGDPENPYKGCPPKYDLKKTKCRGAYEI